VAHVYAEMAKEMLDKALLTISEVVEEVVKRSEGRKRKLKTMRLSG
jgi:hypothetical protein